MKNKQYKTIYPSIVPKGSIGTCIDVLHTYVRVFKIEFHNGECFWFMSRDLKEIE